MKSITVALCSHCYFVLCQVIARIVIFTYKFALVFCICGDFTRLFNKSAVVRLSRSMCVLFRNVVKLGLMTMMHLMLKQNRCRRELEPLTEVGFQMLTFIIIIIIAVCAQGT